MDKQGTYFNLKQTKDKMMARVFSNSQWLYNQWVHRSEFIEFDTSPWQALSIEISKCRLALITTSGVHLRSQSPFDMNDPAGDPSYRKIPAEACASDLTITHNYYDHSDADKDINIVLPIERVRTLERAGDIGSVNSRHFSFMGHIMHHHIDTLITDSVPRVIDNLKNDEVDVVILTPA